MLLSTEAFEALVKVSTTKKAIASDSRSSKLQRLHLQFQPQRKTNFCRLSLLNLPSACTLQTVKDFLLAKWKSHKLQQRLSPIKFPTTLSSNGESFSSFSHSNKVSQSKWKSFAWHGGRATVATEHETRGERSLMFELQQNIRK